jgi:5-methylcytosine-specific restriction endonuclease McrA
MDSRRSLEYERYIRSEAWYRRRWLRIMAANFECEVCHSPHSLDCHHKTYIRLGYELDTDLEVLCRYCHKQKEKRA